MLPDDKLSSQPVFGTYLYDLGVELTPALDYKAGGKGIQDPYSGLDYQVWRGRLFEAGTEDSHIVLDGRFSPEFHFFDYPNMVEINFSFDFNMKPMCVFIAREIAVLSNGEEVVEFNAYLYWYDTTINKYDLIFFGNTVKTPKLLIDDPRELESQFYSKSDVCLFYWRSGNLQVRYLRERFTIEHTLKRNVPYIEKVGMTDKLRLQIDFLKTKQDCQK